MDCASNDIHATLSGAGGGACEGTRGLSGGAQGGALAGEALLSLRSSRAKTQSSVNISPQPQSTSDSLDCDSSNVHTRDNENNETYSLYNLQQQQQQRSLNNNPNTYESGSHQHCTEEDVARVETCLSRVHPPPPYKIGCEAKEEELKADSVDLLKMLPEAQRCRQERHPASCGNSLKLARVTVPDTHEVERLYQPACLEELTGEPAYSDIYHALHAVGGTINSGRMTPVSLTEGLPGTFMGTSSGADERVAFYTMPHASCPMAAANMTDSDFQPIYETRPNNQQAAVNLDYRNLRPSGIAQYCTSKVHSRSCGNLTCPKYDSKHIGRPKGRADQRRRQVLHLDKCKRWAFLVVIFLGIVLAVTGIIVGFMVVAPFKYKASRCEIGKIFCADYGCVLPQLLCAGTIQCADVHLTSICLNINNGTDMSIYGTKDHPLIAGEDVPLGPHTFNPQEISNDDLEAWVHFMDGSNLGNGSKYFTVNKAMTFQSAQDLCREHSGHVVHINSMREQIFIEDYLKWVLDLRGTSRDLLGYWLGARRDRGSHSGSCMYEQWKWVDAYRHTHGFVAGFTAFAPGKPDNFYGPEECLYATISSKDPDGFLKWDDAPCDIQGIGSIRVVCEIDLSIPGDRRKQKGVT